MKTRGIVSALVLGLSLLAPLTAFAEGSPRTEEEVQLEQTESSVLDIRRELFVARQKGDKEEIKRLQKKYDELQKERLRLLRATWKM